MPYILQTRDLTKQYLQYGRSLNDYRPIANGIYTPGSCMQLVPLDQQQYPDQGTVKAPAAAAGQSLIVGVVSETWPGFSGAGFPPIYVAPSSVVQVIGGAGARGTQGVLLNVRGYHPSVLVDATAGTALADGTLLIPSATTSGYSQGTATVPTVAFGTVGGALLPAAGMGSAITTGALVQASQTATIAGTVTAGDVINLSIQFPYTPINPGVVNMQTFSYTIPTGGTATTAATAFAAQLNGNAGFAQYYTASSAAGVMTIAVNANAAPFLVTVNTGGALSGQWSLDLSGSVGNSVAIATSVNLAPGGGTTFVAGGATLAGGAGFKGTIPAFVTGANV